MGNNKIGIVTILYNSENVLKEYFNSLNEQTFNEFRLYVVDNKSPDNSLPVAKKLADQVQFETVFIENKDNLGVAGGNNIGIKQALKDGCEFILLSNNDIVLSSGAIDLLLKGMKEEKASMAVPKIFYYHSNKLWCAGGGFDYKEGSTYHRGVNEPDSEKFNKRLFVDYAPTCFMLLNKDIFDKVGFMNEKYFIYYDDSDFLFRATMKRGEKLIYIPEATIQHNVSSSTGGLNSEFFVYYFNRNRLYFIYNHMSKLLLIRIFVTSYFRFLLKSILNHKNQRAIWLSGLKGLGAGLKLIIE